MSGPDEFEQIARLYRPLTKGAAEAFDLLDDAAAIPSRPGFDLVITKDAMVQGVHFLSDEAPDLIARKLLRVNLSDLAAKGAEPYGYFLAVAWPPSFGWSERQAFAAGLAKDGANLVLLGGDTVSTPGPLMASLTMLGWVPTGRMIRRGGARVGDLVMVSGVIGDGWLGLAAARRELDDPDGYLADRYRLPTPRLDLRAALRDRAHAAADVSDGLIADAGHIAKASGAGLRLNLERLPLSPAAHRWLGLQDDRATALRALASGGDDYEIVCAVAPDAVRIPGLTLIGEIVAGAGVEVLVDGVPIDAGAGGWRHG
ncbi:thiamine-phosphate kinase [Phenylobacterium sp. LH3H17]|uniref:thiamine-phosphate kinase n=1 Tax=Phenylobacterium sp. LH3H17 TaxID=2903901 RepID=UPI0020C947F3|nr:thiamine-phosphate kinase [Phenylobacterium sp. LH3H17]UTP37827.1 thiamine-phosphate kinase [Phenylobacterium sp. LH3H17]